MYRAALSPKEGYPSPPLGRGKMVKGQRGQRERLKSPHSHRCWRRRERQMEREGERSELEGQVEHEK